MSQQAPCAQQPARGTSWLGGALGATAVSGQMKLEVFFSVIVGKLFARLDRADRKDTNAPVTKPDLAIGYARVIDVASSVRGNIAIDHARVTRPEEVLPAVVLDLFGCSGAPKVFDHE